jgi:L-aspartate oxidase
MTIPRRDIGMAPLVIGAGLAGLMTALRLAPLPVVILTKAPLGEGTSSGWAQGGIAAAIGLDDDPALHCADTVTAGDGLCDAKIVERITAAAPSAIETLAHYGVRFDRDNGTLALGLEAAHSRHRIIHADGDGTGREIMRAVTEAVRATPSITVLIGTARQLMTVDGAIAGVWAISAEGPMLLPTHRVVMATGGLGGLFQQTTNPSGARGEGLALAARAGAVLADMEFIQFHPTALADGRSPMSLVSEAVRGAGATLVNEAGERFMLGIPGAELAPRDVVARAMWRQLTLGHRCFLDARSSLGDDFAPRFPGITKRCLAAGIDPARQPIPVRPAAHYHMGGIAVDSDGRSTVPGLWACGEAAATGLHGANRLASNSLLEAIVGADLVAENVAGTRAGRPVRNTEMTMPPIAVLGRVPTMMTRGVGILRDHYGLVQAAASLLPLTDARCPEADPALVALMVTMAALQRQESRGAHYRSDFPRKDPVFGQRSQLTWDTAQRAAQDIITFSPRSQECLTI